MKDLRNHPLFLFVELVLLGGIGALLVGHLWLAERRADPPPAFEEAVMPIAAMPDLAPSTPLSRTIAAEDASILVRDPYDRSEESASTPQADYFLELEHAAPLGCVGYDESAPYAVTLGRGGNHVVYEVEGNLWVHSHEALALSLVAERGAVRVTFLVKGNVYFLDSLVQRPSDAVTFVALDDDDGTGGYIWLGDVSYGTLAEIDAFLYAEHDIIGAGLDHPTRVRGALAAGDQIMVFDARHGGRGQLVVEHDPRWSSLASGMPGFIGR
jgi:hypothetical protein